MLDAIQISLALWIMIVCATVKTIELLFSDTSQVKAEKAIQTRTHIQAAITTAIAPR